VNDATYYENPKHWEIDRYINPLQTERYADAISLIPEDVREIIDVGCGNGLFLKYLKDQNKYQCIGLERSKSAIEVGTRELGVRIVEGSMDCMNFSEHSFDMVTSMEVLEHLPGDVYQRALREMERIARRYILINVPYRERRKFSECPDCGCVFPNCYHMRSFDDDALSHLFSRFRLIKSKHTGIKREALIWYLWNLTRTKFKRPFSELSLCPLCGLVAPETGSGVVVAPSTISKFKSHLRKSKIMNSVRVKVAGEIVCLYMKID
jgi:SAM-dependent methyltransferase